MTRKEEIIQAVNNYKNHFPDGFINEFVYIDGAKWADNNPDERMIAKYLYEKKGYPIDLNGHLPLFEETMKDVEKYNKYKEDKFIEKACEWLQTNRDHPLIGCEDPCLSGYLTSAFIEDFKTYMKGE